MLSFDAQDLASRILPWTGNWNVSSGTLGIDLHAEWQPSAKGWVLAGQSSVQVTNLAGIVNETVFLGLSTRIDTVFDSTNDIVAEPSYITIGLLEV